MPSVRKNALVPFSAESMFDLVADVRAYPEFLPWCGGTSVLSEDEHGMVASIRIAFKGMSQTFTTRNQHDRPQRIVLTLQDGPFSRLEGVWTFKALTPTACRIDLALDYEMKAGLLAKLLGPVFNPIAQSMVDAFVRRAGDLQARKAQG
jgi:ribosome-associated toxin RatA of RatAB toxin-antitoxin module